MNSETYQKIEQYMLSSMDDSAHDAQHIYRVLYNALQIAASIPETDRDVLITACLLHDIGRREQFADPSLCHAAVGSEKARNFLLEQGFSADFGDSSLARGDKTKKLLTKGGAACYNQCIIQYTKPLKRR